MHYRDFEHAYDTEFDCVALLGVKNLIETWYMFSIPLISYRYEWDEQQTVALPLDLGSVHVETHTTEPRPTNKQHYAARHSQDGIQMDSICQCNNLS